MIPSKDSHTGTCVAYYRARVAELEAKMPKGRRYICSIHGPLYTTDTTGKDLGWCPICAAGEQRERADAAEAERDRLAIALSNISGALCDAATVPVPDDPMGYADAVRAITAERDRLAVVARAFKEPVRSLLHWVAQAKTAADHEGANSACKERAFCAEEVGCFADKLRSLAQFSDEKRAALADSEEK